MKLSRSWLVTLGLLAVGAFFMLPSLGIGIGGLFTFLLILACPLMHLFMMRGHGGHGGHDHGAGGPEPPAPDVKATLPPEGKKALEG